MRLIRRPKTFGSAARHLGFQPLGEDVAIPALFASSSYAAQAARTCTSHCSRGDHPIASCQKTDGSAFPCVLHVKMCSMLWPGDSRIVSASDRAYSLLAARPGSFSAAAVFPAARAEGSVWSQVQRRAISRRSREPDQAVARPETHAQLPKNACVRIVNPDGSHRVIPYQQALEEAAAARTDLIMLARNADPPVMRLGEAQKALEEQRRKAKELKKRQLEARRAQAVKEVRVGAKIAEHDLERQLTLARGFLEKGYKVKLLILIPRGQFKEAVSKLHDVKQRAAEWADVAAPAPNDRIQANAMAVILTQQPAAQTAE